MIERKIGEIFSYNGQTVKVIKSASCLGCMFHNEREHCQKNKDITGLCGIWSRSDGISVIFYAIKDIESIDVNKECDR